GPVDEPGADPRPGAGAVPADVAEVREGSEHRGIVGHRTDDTRQSVVLPRGVPAPGGAAPHTPPRVRGGAAALRAHRRARGLHPRFTPAPPPPAPGGERGGRAPPGPAGPGQPALPSSSGICSPASLTSLTVSTPRQNPSMRYPKSRPSSASRGKVEDSWSPFSGRSAVSSGSKRQTPALIQN